MNRCLGFDYHFNAIQDESNELFCAYKDMFEVSISQKRVFRNILDIYLPIANRIYVSRFQTHIGAFSLTRS
jgi:hypothetical protein